jgi:hypothetical protein
MASLLTRVLREGSVGNDVYGCKRSVCRALDAHDHGHRLAALEAESASVKRTFGPFFKIQVNQCRKLMGLRQTGLVDQTMWSALVRGHWPDARAIELMNSYIDAHPAHTLVFPVPLGEMGSVCQGLHETAGLAGNWAIDFCCPANTTIVAVETAVITKLSGKAPSQDTADLSGTYGWSIHYRTPAGYRYFWTHFGSRLPTLKVGMNVQAGDTLGKVGDQLYRPDHIHGGVTSPVSTADAKKRITAVSKAPRID